MTPPLGVHFLAPTGPGQPEWKPWDRLQHRTFPLVEAAWLFDPWDGHSLDHTIDRLIWQCDYLWSRAAPVYLRPYLRIDHRSGRYQGTALTVAYADDYFFGVEHAMRRWMDRADSLPVLRVILGNEPNLESEGGLQPYDVAPVVAEIIARRNALWPNHPNRPLVYTPAMGPWNRFSNCLDPQDLAPFDSNESVNHTYGLHRRLAEMGRIPDGAALHVYGTWVVPNQQHAGYWDSEPFADVFEGDRPGCWSTSRAWRNHRDAVFAGCGPVTLVASEVNCNWMGRTSAENYCAGWLQNLLTDLATEPLVEAACWFVGRDSHSWHGDSLEGREGAANPGGGMAAADDDANLLWGMVP